MVSKTKLGAKKRMQTRTRRLDNTSPLSNFHEFFFCVGLALAFFHFSPSHCFVWNLERTMSKVTFVLSTQNSKKAKGKQSL